MLANPGEARGCSTNTSVIHQLSHPLVKISVRAVMPKRLNMVLPVIFSEILNLEGHQNRFIGSKVTRILLNGWILPTGWASSERVGASSLRIRLVLAYIEQLYYNFSWRGYSITIEYKKLCQWLKHLFLNYCYKYESK